MHAKLNERLSITVEVTDENRSERLVQKAITRQQSEDKEHGGEVTVADQVTEVEIDIPSQIDLCGKCSGKGSHSLRFGAFTGDAWSELDDDFKEDYMSGRFDEPCDRCGGTGRLLVPAENLTPFLAKLIEEADEEETEYRAERFSEMRAQYGLEWGPEYGDE